MSTTIDDKLRLFHKAIFEKLEEKKNKQLEDFRLDREEAIREKKEELEKKLMAAKKESFKKANTRALEIISKEESKSNREILGLKGKLIKEVETALQEKLTEFAASDSYKSFIMEKLEASLKSLQRGSYILFALEKDIEALQEDIKHLEAKCNNIKLTYNPLDEDYIGGFIIEDEEFIYKYDCTLKNMLLENKETIGIMVTEALA
ncbi:V-type ATP synthase subunit E [Alloiococcus sp. CFN-8]|uniref:V-type ATP synthase subunit E n=1 Tax=Alloiococcus sp. CFN-8 TaxID=3416081 RepID=UPI003CEF33B2